MIAGYFDDSSDDKMMEFVCSGGIVEDEFKVAALDVRWQEATKILSEPFRSTDCECQLGQFVGWSKPECNALMANLIKIMSNSRLAVGAFAQVIPIQSYRKVFPKSAREAPYMLAVRMTVIEMARLAARSKERVKVWFEEGPHQGKISEAYYELKTYEPWKARDKLAGISFDGKEVRPLQAADLVAREGFKHAANLGKRPLRKPLAGLWERCGIVIWTSETLRVLRDNGGPENLGFLTDMPQGLYLTERPLTEKRFYSK